jgi:autotransporter-associated beta strand protein
MYTKLIMSLILLPAAISLALAATTIDAGTHYILPDDVRTIAVRVSGGDLVEALNFFVQVADGGDANMGTATKPKITGIDIIGPGTIFYQHNTGSTPYHLPDSGGTYLIWMDTTAAPRGETVSASGALAFLTIDTTGTTSLDDPYPLTLENVAANSEFAPPGGFSTDFGNGEPTINAGQIVIVDIDDLTWNKSDNGLWTETTWTGSPPPYPNYTARAIVDTNYIVHVDDAQEANKLTLSGGGTVAISSTGSLAVTTDVNINSGGVLAVVTGASLTATGINLSGGKISGSGTINPAVTLTGGTLDAPALSDILTINSSLDGTGGLIKSGSGKVTLEDNAVYEGDTSITGGLLQLNGAANSLENISGSGSLGVGGDSPATLTADSISVNTLTIGAGSKVAIRPLPGGMSLAGANTILPVPEPSTGILLAISGALLVFMIFRGF